ncbi:co-chaperone YbbN, partial [Marinitenerispora sediminis]
MRGGAARRAGRGRRPGRPGGEPAAPPAGALPEGSRTPGRGGSGGGPG